jgi:cell division protein FtsB
MKICARVDNPGAVLRQRLEALAAQLAELESLRDRVDREENHQRELRQSGYLRRRASSECNRAVAATSQI